MNCATKISNQDERNYLELSLNKDTCVLKCTLLLCYLSLILRAGSVAYQEIKVFTTNGVEYVLLRKSKVELSLGT